MVELELAPSSPAMLISKDDLVPFEKEKSRIVLKTTLP